MSFSQMNLYFNWIYDHISNLIPSSVSTERLLRLVSLFDRINVAMTIRPNDQGLGNKISRVLSVFLSLHHGASVKKLSLAALSALVLPRPRINSPIMVLLQVFFSQCLRFDIRNLLSLRYFVTVLCGLRYICYKSAGMLWKECWKCSSYESSTSRNDDKR